MSYTLADLYTLVQPWVLNAALHMEQPYAWLELCSAACALLGSLVLALKGKHSGWGWVLFAFSNAGWIIFANGYGHWFFLVQQIGFSITSAIGIWTYLLRGGEHDAAFATFSSPEYHPAPLRIAINRVTHFQALTLHIGRTSQTRSATQIHLDNGSKLVVLEDAAAVEARLSKRWLS